MGDRDTLFVGKGLITMAVTVLVVTSTVTLGGAARVDSDAGGADIEQATADSPVDSSSRMNASWSRADRLKMVAGSGQDGPGSKQLIEAGWGRAEELRAIGAGHWQTNSTSTSTVTPEDTSTATPDGTSTITPDHTSTATPETTPTATPDGTSTITPDHTSTATPETTPTPTTTANTTAPSAASQNQPSQFGAAPNASLTGDRVSPTSVSPQAAGPVDRYQYSSQLFTVSDIVFFGYGNDTNIATSVGEFSLNRGGFNSLDVPQGTYALSGSKRFSVLTGDPISRTVAGYYAVDENGFPVGTELRTWIPSNAFSNERLTVFAYENDTQVTVRDEDTGTVLLKEVIDRGEHADLIDTAEQSYVVVESNKSVSALTHYDQGYYVPAASGTFVGRTFHTFASSIAATQHDLVVSGYSQNTQVTIKNSETGAIIWSGEIDAGQSHTESFSSPTYITVESDAGVSVSVQPHDTYQSGGYYHGLYVPAKSGSYIGTDFVEASTGTDSMILFSYADDTQATVIDSNGNVRNQYVLDRGETVDAAPGYGTFRVISNKSLSIYSGYSTYSAEFGPIEFGQSEDATVTGTVRDVTDDPVASAQVRVLPLTELYKILDLRNIRETLSGASLRGETDSEGRYSIGDIPPGDYVVVAYTEKDDGSLSIDWRVTRLVKSETGRLSFSLGQNYLGPVIREMQGLRQDSRAVLDENTRTAAGVHVTAYEAFYKEDAIDRVAPDALGAYLTYIDILTTATDPDKAVKEFVEDEARDVIGEAVVTSAIESGTRRFTEPGVRGKLEDDTTEVDNTAWMEDFRYADDSESVVISQGYQQTDEYRETTSHLQSNESQLEAYASDIERSEVPDEFSRAAVVDVLQEQRAWVRGEGPANGLVITPTGNVYLIKQSQEHAETFYQATQTMRTAKTAEQVSDIISTTSGYVAIVAPPGTGVKSTAATTAAASEAASYAFLAVKVAAKFKMGIEQGSTQVYWMQDADNIDLMYNDTVSWVREEVRDPSVHTASGSIESTDIHGTDIPTRDVQVVIPNRPDYPPYWPPFLPAIQWKAVYNNTVTVRNTGDAEAMETRILVADHYGKTDAVSKVPGVYPDPSSGPMRLDPGETRTVDVPYTASFHPEEPFEFHYQDTILWAEGRIVDENRDVYYVVPSRDTPIWDEVSSELPTLAADSDAQRDIDERAVRSADFDYSTTSAPKVTATEWATYVGNATKLVDAELSPTRTNVTTTYDIESDPHNVTFLMVTETGAAVDLNVYDSAGRHVGPDVETGTDEVQIPNATYTGNQSNPERVTVTNPADTSSTYRVTVDSSRFTTNESISVEVFAVTEPQRPPILGVSPARAQLSGSPSVGSAANLTVAEVSNQHDVTGVSVTAGEFTTDAGQPLPTGADVSLATQSFDLKAGGEQTVRATLDTSSLTTVDTAETRYNGTVQIQSSRVEPLVANLSVLLLDSDDENLELVGGGLGVDGVHATNATGTASLPDGLPTDVAPARTYEMDLSGSGNVTFRVDEVTNPAGARTFGYTGDRWIELSAAEQDDLVTTDVPASVQMLVIARPTIDVALDLAVGPNATTVAAQSATAGHPVTIQLTQQTYGAVLRNVSAVSSTGQSVTATEQTPTDWTLNTTFANNTYNESTGTYDTVRVQVTAEGRARTVTTNITVEVWGEGDANGDGRVNIFDAVIVGNSWQTTAGDPGYSYRADLNKDGVVNIFDAVMIGRNWRESVAE